MELVVRSANTASPFEESLLYLRSRAISCIRLRGSRTTITKNTSSVHVYRRKSEAEQAGRRGRHVRLIANTRSGRCALPRLWLPAWLLCPIAICVNMSIVAGDMHNFKSRSTCIYIQGAQADGTYYIQSWTEYTYHSSAMKGLVSALGFSRSITDATDRESAAFVTSKPVKTRHRRVQ